MSRWVKVVPSDPALNWNYQWLFINLRFYLYCCWALEVTGLY